jgi:hypothetical protein
MQPPHYLHLVFSRFPYSGNPLQMKKPSALRWSIALLVVAPLGDLHAQETFRDALTAGTPSLNLRYRFETVDSDIPGQDRTALGSTLRTAFGYRTGSFHDFQAFFEFEDTANLWDDLYNDLGGNGKTEYPVIADPGGSAVNQVYLDYVYQPGTLLRAGRQEIILDNARFVGNVGWRQNHQSFDALSLAASPLESLDLTYLYLEGVHTPTGLDLDASAQLLNARYELDSGQILVAYYYHLDVEDAPLASSATAGARFKGVQMLSDSVDLNYALEYAKQKDVGDNPNGVSADYFNVSLAPKYKGIDFELAMEHLGGSGSNGNKFTTPFATGHKFNGYADQFLTVPDAGLDDLSLGIGGELGGIQCRLTYHQFQSDEDSLDYGSEVDLTLIKQWGANTTLGLKLAAFEADDDDAGFNDITKLMFWTSYRIL